MPARLSPEEREARRKERSRRSFSEAAYTNRYDPRTEGYGSEEEWRGTVKERLGAGPVLTASADMVLLGLTEMPKTNKDLHAVYRSVSRTVHPNAPGGSHDAFIALRAAYERLLEEYR